MLADIARVRATAASSYAEIGEPHGTVSRQSFSCCFCHGGWYDILPLIGKSWRRSSGSFAGSER